MYVTKGLQGNQTCTHQSIWHDEYPYQVLSYYLKRYESTINRICFYSLFMKDNSKQGTPIIFSSDSNRLDLIYNPYQILSKYLKGNLGVGDKY